jgi:hypothetical protein
MSSLNKEDAATVAELDALRRRAADLDTEMENAIIKRTIADLLAAGYWLSVHDGGEVTVKHSTDKDAIFAAMRTTGEDYLIANRQGDAAGRPTVYHAWIRFIYSNGPDVLADYTVNLENDLTNANALANALDGIGR